MFFCEYCEILKSSFLEEHLRNGAFGLETIIFDEALQQFFKALECAMKNLELLF